MAIQKHLAEKILKAKPTSGARYPYIDKSDAVLGDYDLEIETFKQITGQVDKHDKFIAEFIVHGTPDPEKQPKGSRLQWIRTPAIAKFPDQQWSEIRDLVLSALHDVDISTLTEAEVEEAYGPTNPLGGRRISAKVFKKPSGFVCVRFTPPAVAKAA